MRIPFRDSSWVYGDGGFDMTRTFGHRLFKVKEHVDRLYRSLKYLRIDPGFGPAKMCALTEELLDRNRHLLGPDDDYWVGQRISRGVKETPGDNLDYHGPNVVLECAPLPLVQRAKLFKEGIRVVIPSHRRVPPDSLTPRAKTHNYLNLIVANQEVQAIDPEAWALLLDATVNLCEGMGPTFTVLEAKSSPAREVRGCRWWRQTRDRPGAQEGWRARADTTLRRLHAERCSSPPRRWHLPRDQGQRHAIGRRTVWGPVTIASEPHRFVDQTSSPYLKRYVTAWSARF